MNNYHSHTALCKHADGEVSDYARVAAQRGMKILGVSDHSPLPDGRWSWVRMSMEELDGYEGQIDLARELYPKLKILKALECEWDRDYRNFYREEILYRRNFDYLVGAVHWVPYHGDFLELSELENASHLRAYADIIIKTMNSGLFSFIAHPDAFGSGYTRWDENSKSCALDIIAAARDLDVPLEINGYGFRKSPVYGPKGPQRRYPIEEFWRIAGEYTVRALVNSDAHDPEDIDASLDQAAELGRRCRVELIQELNPLSVA